MNNLLAYWVHQANNNNLRGETKMSEVTKRENEFVGYEYRTVTVRRDMRDIYQDSYRSFGWTPDGYGFTTQGVRSVNMKFKRNRRISNKAEIVRLQREFESHVKELEKIEDSKVIAPSIAGYGLGLVGTAFMAGATFSFLGNIIPAFIVLGALGFALWAAAYFVYMKVKRNSTEKATPIIDSKYDAIYEVCERASGLLNA